MIEQLAIWLRDDDQAVRAEAARALAKIGEPGLQVLVAALDDERGGIRQWAVLGLGETGRDNAVRPLDRALDDPQVTYFAILGLGMLGRNGVRSAALPLIRILKHAEGSLRARAAAELGFMKATEAIPDLLAMLADPDAMARCWAVDALGEMGDRSVIPRLIAIMPIADSDMRGRIIRALGHLGAGDEMIGPVVECLGSESRGVNSAAAHALAKLGAPSLQPVLQVARDGSPTARAWALWTLCLLGDPQAFETVRDAMNDPDTEVRARAAEALGGISDPRGFEPLLKASKDPTIRVRSSAIYALGCTRDARALVPLIEMLRDSQESSVAADALGELGDPGAVGPLLDYVRNGGYADAAGPALRELGQESVTVQRQIHDALADDHPGVREAAVRALATRAFSWAFELVAGKLADEDCDVRFAAVDTLAHINAARAYPILASLLAGEASTACEWIMRTMARMERWMDAPPDVDLLLRALSHDNPDVRHFAARKLGEFGDERALDALLARQAVESGVTSTGESVRDELIRAAKLIQVRMLARA